MRILSFNVHKGMGWVGKSTLSQIRAQIQALHPDLIFLQEICGSQFEFLAAENWPHFSYGRNANNLKGHHGNAILSKFPIVFSQNNDISMGRFERRGLLHSIVQSSILSQPIHLICTHLSLFKNYRRKQLEEIINYVEKNTPSNSPLIIGGDFNDWRSHATEPMVERLGLQESFLHRYGEYAKTFPAWIPLLKLDRIYSRGFETCEAECLTHKTWKTLSDHIGLNVKLILDPDNLSFK